MKLQPWQAEMLIKLEEGHSPSKGSEMVFMAAGRRVGKSNWQQLFRSFMERPEKRFQLASSPLDTQNYLLMIVDYMWWTENEREILNWMETNLPNGIEHQQGMVIRFDTDKQRMAFLLRWA